MTLNTFHLRLELYESLPDGQLPSIEAQTALLNLSQKVGKIAPGRLYKTLNRSDELCVKVNSIFHCYYKKEGSEVVAIFLLQDIVHVLKNLDSSLHSTICSLVNRLHKTYSLKQIVKKQIPESRKKANMLVKIMESCFDDRLYPIISDMVKKSLMTYRQIKKCLDELNNDVTSLCNLQNVYLTTFSYLYPVCCSFKDYQKISKTLWCSEALDESVIKDSYQRFFSLANVMRLPKYSKILLKHSKIYPEIFLFICLKAYLFSEREDLGRFSHVGLLEHEALVSGSRLSVSFLQSCSARYSTKRWNEINSLIDRLSHLDVVHAIFQAPKELDSLESLEKLCLMRKELIEKATLEECQQFWTVHGVRDLKFILDFGYSKEASGQVLYGKMMHLGILMAKQMIETNSSIKMIFYVLGLHRKYMASEVGHETSAYYFGTDRYVHYSSYCESGSYSVLQESFAKFHSTPDGKYYIKLSESLGQFIGYIDGQKVLLSQIHFDTSGKAETIFHTFPEYISSIMEYVETLFFQALKEEEKKEVIAICAEIFWWICQAKPWMRGDPSIAEMFIKSILHFKNITLKKWKMGIIPWVEVMKCATATEFSQKFEQLFSS